MKLKANDYSLNWLIKEEKYCKNQSNNPKNLQLKIIIYNYSLFKVSLIILIQSSLIVNTLTIKPKE